MPSNSLSITQRADMADLASIYTCSVTRTVSLASLFGFARHCHELQVRRASAHAVAPTLLLCLMPRCLGCGIA